MPQLQPYVSNIPLQVAANLRFDDDNGIPVTQMLPVGMNGVTPNDNPKTGYISRIGSVLSQQIDLYRNVLQTLSNYGGDITQLQQQVAALEISGTTIPLVNGHCFTGDANSPITTVVDLVGASLCDYIDVLGTTSNLMQAILAEGAATLNVMPSFSILAGNMQALSGWIPTPETVADTINNLWLSYLDSRSGVSAALAQMTPSCSQAIINFATNYVTASGTGSGFFVYFSGYSFIPSAYADNGSTITITDGLGGIYTTGVNIVTRSQPGADSLFVGISGTALSPNVSNYQVTLSAVIKSSSNTCTKAVIHDINIFTPTPPSSTVYPRTVISNDLLAQTSGVTSVISYVPIATGTFQMSGYTTTVSISGYTLLGTLTYSDENGSDQSISIISSAVTGPLSLNRIIRARGGSTIKVATSLSSSGSINYDIGIVLVQLS